MQPTPGSHYLTLAVDKPAGAMTALDTPASSRAPYPVPRASSTLRRRVPASANLVPVVTIFLRVDREAAGFLKHILFHKVSPIADSDLVRPEHPAGMNSFKTIPAFDSTTNALAGLWERT